ncbi:hypothetical protein P8936_06545 [Edaphobacter paludis]
MVTPPQIWHVLETPEQKAAAADVGSRSDPDLSVMINNFCENLVFERQEDMAQKGEALLNTSEDDGLNGEQFDLHGRSMFCRRLW